MNNQDQDLSTIERVRAYLQSILSPEQLAQLDQMLQGVDLNSGGPARACGAAGGRH
jgi:hypothetical protein